MIAKKVIYILISISITVPYIFTMEKPTGRSPVEDVFKAVKVFLDLESEHRGLPPELNREIIKHIKHSIEEKISNENGQALLEAIQKYDFDEARRLLKETYINTNLQTEYHKTPLMLVIAETKYLHQPRRRSIWAAYQPEPRYPNEGELLEMAKMLLQKGADPDSSLESAVMLNQPMIVKMLLEAGANPNLQNERGWTALNWAVDTYEPGMPNEFIQNKKMIVKILLEAGANPNLQDKEGWTALNWALRQNKQTMVEMLLEAGADPNFIPVNAIRSRS